MTQDSIDYEYLSIPDFFDSAAQQHSARPFVFDGERSLTYGECLEAQLRVSGALIRLGVKVGDRVALALENTLEHLVTWLAVVRLGAVAVSLNPRLAPPEILNHVRLIDTALCLCEQPDTLQLPRVIQIVRPLDLFDGEPWQDPSPARGGHVAAMIATSGSTGRPKAVMQSHRTYVLTGQAFGHWIGLRPDDRMLAVLPLHHINAQAYSVMGAIGMGASLVLERRFSASRFWDRIRAAGVTQFNAVGAMIPILLSQPRRADDADNPARLCYVALALPEETHKHFEQRFGLRMTVGYGLSEATFGTVWPAHQSPYGTIGRIRQHPVLGNINHSRIVDEQGRDVPSGRTGELLLRNPATFSGYYKDSVATHEVMRDGWLWTGDLVREDADGMITFVARRKEVMRRRGENVIPAEIERVLADHPAIQEAAVLGVPSPLGEENIRAVIVFVEGQNLDDVQLRAWCAQSLAEFKVPDEFVVTDRLPRTETHRVAKHLLRDLNA